MSQDGDDLKRLHAALDAAGWDTPRIIEPGTQAITSPMRIALEWSGWHLVAGGKACYAKVLHADVLPLVDVSLSAAAARHAAAAGVGPAVSLADVERGVLVLDALPKDEWRAAFVDDLAAPTALTDVWHLTRQLHRYPASPATGQLPRRSLVADLEKLTAMCDGDGVYMPMDAGALGDHALEGAAALLALQRDWVAIHGDGAACNVMMHRDGRRQFVDFDRGGLGDPWYDVAVVLNECCQFEAQWREGIAAWQGICSDLDYARCRLYGFVDDWLWTLTMLWLSDTSARGLDFMKLGQWTLLRCRQARLEEQSAAWLGTIQAAVQAARQDAGQDAGQDARQDNRAPMTLDTLPQRQSSVLGQLATSREGL